MAAISNDPESRRLAAQLVGVRRAPAGYDAARLLALEAKAYHDLAPYPYWHFREWKLEERGPYPRAMPFSRTAVKRSASWLWGRSPQITLPGNEALERWLREQWQANRMPARLLAASERAGYQGGLALKFSYDSRKSPALQIATLSLIDHCRLYYHPHDRHRLLMARIQYPYYHPAEDRWLLYREEWTDEEEVHYEPLEARNVGMRVGRHLVGEDWVTAQGREDVDQTGQWRERTRRPNPFGVIPLQPVRNLETDDVWGVGDLWGLFRTVDRVNLTYHLQDRSNQRDEPNLVFLDIDAEKTDIDRPLAPNQPLSVKSDEGDGGEPRRGDVKLLEARGDLREHMAAYARDLRQQVLLDCGSVEVDPAAITNKGNLTSAVLAQLYGPLIELTEKKRRTYGEDGVCKFLERAAVGLKNAGFEQSALAGVQCDQHDTYDVQLTWPAYFTRSEEEKQAVVNRVTSELQARLMTPERAVETVAEMEGIEDVPRFKEELAGLEPADAGEKAAAAYKNGLITRNEARRQIGLGPAHEADAGPSDGDAGDAADE